MLTDEGQSVSTAFWRSVERWPDRTAAVDAEVSLTFAGVAERTERLAAVLRERGVGPGVPVVSCLTPDVAVPIAMLGIWLARGVYVPVDPGMPSARLRYVFDDCRATLILVKQGAPLDFVVPGVVVIEMDDTGTVVHLGAPVGNATHRAGGQETPDPQDLAYVIYTSGSTGRPKGVLIEHSNLAEMATNYEASLFAPLPKPIRRVCVNNPLITDSAISDLLHICFGRTLHFVDSATRRDPDSMAAFLLEQQIEFLDATPTQVRSLLMAGHEHALRSLSVLIVGGESTDDTLWKALQDLTNVAVFNLYGPTECTVAVTFADVRAADEPTIGIEFSNCPVHLLDNALDPVAEGAVGEICVAGVQVARGYLNAAAQQADRFTTFTPRGCAESLRIYRTGDRARRTAAGSLEFLGRTDDQVKIRGYRVELGELEAALRLSDGVLDAAAAVESTGSEAMLRAFVVLASGTTEADVRQELMQALPAYMLPSVSTVASIPVGQTGKADRKALLAANPAEATTTSTASSTPLSMEMHPSVQVLGGIWCELLNLASVDAEADFFELGGDSLKATRMTIKARKQLRLPAIKVSAIFNHPQFADYCEQVITPDLIGP